MKWLLETRCCASASASRICCSASSPCIVVAAFSLYPQMGKDFLPTFKEETALVAATAAPGHLAGGDEQDLRRDRAADPLGARSAQSRPPPRPRRTRRPRRAGLHRGVRRGFPRDEGRPRRRDRKEILADIRERIKTVPGTFTVVGGPLADRIGHMLSGVSAPVAVKIFGPDLDKLRQLGIEIQAVAQDHPRLRGLPSSTSSPPSPSSASRRTATAPAPTASRPASSTSSSPRSSAARKSPSCAKASAPSNLVIRLPLEWRDSPEKLARAAHRDRTHGQQHPALARRRRARGQRAERHLPREQPAPLRPRHQADRARCRHARRAAARQKSRKR